MITIEHVMELADGEESTSEDIPEAAMDKTYTISPPEEPSIVQANYDASGDRRKEPVAAITNLINEKPKYTSMPTHAYQIESYEVSKIGTVTESAYEALTAWLHDNGFDAE